MTTEGTNSPLPQPEEAALQGRAVPLSAIAIAYALLGFLGLSLAIPPGYASPVFPAAGLALAAALHFGPRILPGVLLGSFSLNLGVAILNGTFASPTLAVALGIALGATIQTWIAQAVVRHRQPANWFRLEHERDMLPFLLLGGPVACLVSASVGVSSLAAAGVIEPSQFAYAWWTWYIGDTIGVLLFAPFTVALLRSGTPEWKSRVGIVVGTTLMSLAVVGAAFFAAARWERDDLAMALQRQGNNLANLLQNRFSTHEEVVDALARYVEVTGDFDQHAFQRFTDLILRDQPDIHALSFNPHVPAEGRTAVEAQFAALVPDGRFRITERGPDGKLVPAGTRSDYVPVGYITPFEPNRVALGFDIGSEPRRRDAIERARATGETAITAPLQLVQDQRQHVGVLLLHPVYGAAGELRGFAVAVVKVDDMVEIATRERLASGLVFALSDPASGETMYSSADAALASSDAEPWQSALRVADRSWQLAVSATPSYLQMNRPWLAWAVGIAGLLGATLLQFLLLSITGRTAVTRREVVDKTRQLREQRSALRDSEKALMHAQSVARLGSWELDVPSGRLTWSLETYRLFGVRPGMPLDFDTFLACIHPDDRQRVSDAWDAALAGGAYDIEYRVKANHETRWIHERAEVRWDAMGRAVYALGTALDITRTKQMALDLEAYRDNLETLVKDRTAELESAQRVLAAAEARYRGLVESEAAGIFIAERNALRFVNRTLARMLGYPSAEAMLGEANLEGVLYGEDVEGVRDVFRQNIQGQHTAPLEVTGRRRDGSRVALEIHAVPSTWEQRPAVAGLVLDISARKRIEAELAIEAHRFQMTVEAAPVAILISDADGRIVSVNPALETLLGYRASDLLGESNETLLPREARTQGLVTASDAQAVGREFVLQRRDGRRIHVEIGISETREQDDRLVIATLVDVTERHALLASMAEAKAAAEAASQAKSAFLANMSHEIRTPLHAITGMAHLVKRGGLTEKQSAHMAKLEIASRHLVDVIDAILDLSKIEAGKFDLAEAPFDLEDIVRGVCELVRQRSDAKGLQLVTSVAIPGCRYLGDETRLKQALLNLANNAVKFTETGSITLRVQVDDESGHDALVRFEVEDTGIGVPDDVAQRLFLPFEQADASSTRRYGGTGLGLVITRKIARIMGGDAGLSSQPGVGSTFWFSARLRKHLAAAAPAAGPACDAPLEDCLQQNVGGRRVLLVEDDAINREIARVLLEDIGLRVSEAEDGARAIAAFENASFDLVLMDMQMPVLDGIEATRRIRRLPGGADIPIVAMTANAFSEHRDQCLAAGMNDFLTKPVNAEKVYAALYRWLAKRPSAGSDAGAEVAH